MNELSSMQQVRVVALEAAVEVESARQSGDDTCWSSVESAQNVLEIAKLFERYVDIGLVV